MSDIKPKIENSLNILKDKKSRIYFVAQDTKGNARASIKYIYDVALSLKIMDLILLYYMRRKIIQVWLLGLMRVI